MGRFRFDKVAETWPRRPCRQGGRLLHPARRGGKGVFGEISNAENAQYIDIKRLSWLIRDERAVAPACRAASARVASGALRARLPARNLEGSAGGAGAASAPPARANTRAPIMRLCAHLRAPYGANWRPGPALRGPSAGRAGALLAPRGRRFPPGAGGEAPRKRDRWTAPRRGRLSGQHRVEKARADGQDEQAEQHLQPTAGHCVGEVHAEADRRRRPLGPDHPLPDHHPELPLRAGAGDGNRQGRPQHSGGGRARSRLGLCGRARHDAARHPGRRQALGDRQVLRPAPSRWAPSPRFRRSAISPRARSS